MVYEIMKVGERNALSPDYLRVTLGLTSNRAVQKQIEHERRQGVVRHMEHNQEAALNSDICPVCGGTGYELYMQRVDGYETLLEFARPCTRCRTQRRLQDMTGVLPQFQDADLSKFDFDSYSRDIGNLRKIVEDFLGNFQNRWERAGKVF